MTLLVLPSLECLSSGHTAPRKRVWDAHWQVYD